MKKELKYPKCVLFSNDYYPTDDEVEEYNEEHNTELSAYEIANEINQQNYDDFFDNLSFSEYNNEKCVIFGSLGLWNGTFSIEPVVTDSIEAAINKAISDSDFVEIKQIRGQLEVKAAHHDGTNYFTIRLLNEKGIKTKGDITRSYYHKRFKGYLF